MRGGGWERGGGEESGYFSAYSGCAASVILVSVGLSRIPPSSPHWMAPAFGLGPACPSRTQGEGIGDAYIYVQYLKVINQIQTRKVISIFLFWQICFHNDIKKINLLGNPQDKYLLSLTHEGGCSYFPHLRLGFSFTYQPFLFPTAGTVRILWVWYQNISPYSSKPKLKTGALTPQPRWCWAFQFLKGTWSWKARCTFRTLRLSFCLSSFPHCKGLWVYSATLDHTKAPSTITTHLPLANNALFLALMALGICVIQGWTHPWKRSSQALEAGFIHLGRGGQGPIYLSHGWKRAENGVRL